MSTSIRLLLLRWLLFPLILLLTVASLFGYSFIVRQVSSAYDWSLFDTAQSLARLINVRTDVTTEVLTGYADVLLRTDDFDRIYYSVHRLDGRLLAGDEQLTLPAREDLRTDDFLYDSMLAGEPIRVAALMVNLRGREAIVQVAETVNKRNRMTRHILTVMLAVEVILVAAIVIMVLFAIGKGLRPLDHLREELKARSPRDLRPIEPEHAPIEVQPLVAALNELLARLGTTLKAQQQFLANAAHQLRTPLAGLRTQVEYGLSQSDPSEHVRVLGALRHSTERAVHLANQLLMLARAEAGHLPATSTRQLDLSRAIADVAGDWMPTAIRKKIDLGLILRPAPIRGDPLLIRELLSNLMDNALTYTPCGGRVTVSTATDKDHSVLQIEDDGIGIPEHAHELVFERFYRLDGKGSDGCGLGLAIVQEIAQLHDGKVSIRPPLSGTGTIVVVQFPQGKERASRSHAYPDH